MSIINILEEYANEFSEMLKEFVMEPMNIETKIRIIQKVQEFIDEKLGREIWVVDIALEFNENTLGYKVILSYKTFNNPEIKFMVITISYRASSFNEIIKDL